MTGFSKATRDLVFLKEDAEYDEGADPCQHIVRLYADDAMRVAVEANHAPSVWRR